MELWQIGDSPYAPKFHLAVKPNDWAKALKQSEGQSKELTDTKISQLEFWKEFISYCKTTGTSLRMGRKANAQHWYNISFGTSEAHISFTVSSREKLIACSVYIPKSEDGCAPAGRRRSKRTDTKSTSGPGMRRSAVTGFPMGSWQWTRNF